MTYTLASTRNAGFRCLEIRQASDHCSESAIVWLHGIGERGSDLPLVAKYGLPAALLEGRLTLSADVVCPQLEAGLEWKPSRTKELLVGLRADYERLALVGFSLGGLGVCELLATLGPHADIHVAIAPRVRQFATVSQVGTTFLLLAGEHDQSETTPQFLHELRARGAVVEQAVLPNEGHFISETALKHPTFVNAMASMTIHFGWRQNEG
jgi:hypothetical protein